MVYSLDKLVVYMRVSSRCIDGIVKYWNLGGSDYGEVFKFWIGHHPAVCRNNYTVQSETGDTWYFGVGQYAKAPNEFWEDVKIEFNPAKVGGSKWFAAFYDTLIASAKYVDFKRFDIAIDIPVARSRLRLLKDQRKYALIEYSKENKTEYLGVRSSHGNTKLYNKALEQKMDGDLTRLEITMDYEKATWVEFQRIFPRVFSVSDASPPDNLNGTDLVLFLSCSENPEYLRLLDRYKRKKIERLLATNAQYIKPDELLYRGILSQILYYGKNVKADMWADFAENCIDDDIPDAWTKKEFSPILGDQVDFEKGV